jgi:hypothetical protein
MKKIKIFMAALTVFSLACGCTKDLDLSPKDTISDASFWASASDFQKAANALYSALPGFANFDTDADITFTYPNSASNSTLTTPDTDGSWSSPYTNIRNCNNLLEKADASTLGSSIQVYIAEAKFFRAFNYWLLYSRYGGVPLVTKVLDISSEELYGSRNTAKETVDFILQDLKNAAPDLPEEKDVPLANKGRITRGAANALMARIGLYEGTWRKFHNEGDEATYLDIAIEAANTVINSGQYSLFTAHGDDSYRLLFIDEGDDAPECILDRRYEREVQPHSFPTNNVQIGSSTNPTKLLADMYLCSDGLPVDKSPLFQGYEMRTSEYENRDPRMTQTILIPGSYIYQVLQQTEPMESWPFYPQRVYETGYMIYKYAPQNPNYLIPPFHAQQTYDHHIIRYAEVLLILAEATYEKNGSISDELLDRTVNLLRNRVGFTVYLSNAFVNANGLNMREELRRERTVELAIEGFRRDDLRRWKTAETELVKAIRGIKIVGTEWNQPIIVGVENKNPYLLPEWQDKTDAEGFIVCETATFRANFDPAKNYLMPIPAKQIQLNPNLQQNPKW